VSKAIHGRMGVSTGKRSGRPGRPPINPRGAMTPAERKAAQRERDRARVQASRPAVDQMPTSGLIEALAGLIASKRRVALAAVLVELGLRGGVTVTIQPAASGRGKPKR
jgi:hypothetical protein